MSNQQKMSNKPKSNFASKIPTSGRDSGTHSRSSSVSNLTTASDLHSEVGDVASDNTEDFKIDERVWVNGTKPGYIKFIGKTQFAAGVWAGVLLDEPVGKNDGSVAGVKYFTCEPQRGIFARPSKLTRTAGAVSGIGDSAMVGNIITPSKSTNAPSSRTSVSPNISSSGSKYTKLKVGDRITVSSLSGLKSGTLRYIGETDFAKGEWAGIELDESTGKNDGSVAGKRYFTCELKYGLFAPLHKVSRPGATPVSRPGSVRGTPLLRSNSRDSLNSSISNSSRASRVKLGITSLTSAQKARVAGGIGITSTTKAFEEAIKEKDQHIEQLLKERELDRAEFARLANHFEQIGAKSTELEKRQKLEESEKKYLEEQLSVLQKKFEDTQFQLEEEKIAKTDFQTQLRCKNQILNGLQEYISQECDEKYLRILEMLSTQPLNEVGDAQKAFEVSNTLHKKIAELEATIELISKEKNEVSNHLTELQNAAGASKHESLIASLNTAIQEKDYMIANLKSELNSSIEKVSKLIEDNKNLNDQILLKEEQAKGHADDVIKELGETINSLSEQVKTQSGQLAEHVITIEDKDNKIKTLEHSLKIHSDALLELKNEHEHVRDALKLKESQCEESIFTQKSLEETVIALKSEVETHSGENQKKINLLEEEIKTKSSLLSNYLSSIEEKENLISSLQQNFDSQASSLLQLQNEKKDLNNSLNLKELELGEKAAKLKCLEEQMAEKMLDLVKQIEMLTNSLQEKEDDLLKTQDELNTSHSTIQKLNETVQQLSEKIQEADLALATTSKEATENVISLENKLSALMQEKWDMKSEYEMEIDSVKAAMKVQEDELQLKTDSFAKFESQIAVLTEQLKKSSDEYSMLKKETEDLSEENKEIIKKNEFFEASVKEKEEVIADFTKQFESLKKSLDKSNLNLENNTKELQSLQDSFCEKEQEINHLTSKLQLAEQNVEMLNKDSSDHVMALQNELSKVKEESTITKTHLEQIIQNLQNELKKYTELLENKREELDNKDVEITHLKNVVFEKESQFDELSEMIEDSKSQLTLLKEKNEKNESILQSKESYITDFKIEQEKQLQKKEQSFREEILKFENLIASKNEEINSKECHISSLLKGNEDKEILVCSLQSELEAAKADKKKFSEDSSNIYQDLNSKIMEMEEKYTKLLEEKEKIVKEESQTKDAKKNLELIRDTLLQEKSAQEEIVKDRETELHTLQSTVDRMQSEFAQHKQELQQKLDVSKMELQAASELKNQLDIQHSVIEELHKELHNSEEKCKKLEDQLQLIPVITSEKNQLQVQVDEFQKVNKERLEMITKMEGKYLNLEEQLNNNKNLILQKEKELSSLKEQLQKFPNDKVSSDLSLKSLEEENLALKSKIALLELEKKPDKSTKTSAKLSPEETEERESLLSQIDFLNSIIVDLKQKNEKLSEQFEAQTCWEESDVNLNETKKPIAPRLFCDICEVFDLHETDDCPKQESFADEAVPQLRRAGTRQLEERPYCNNCEVFGHWTLDCEEPETF